MGKIGKKFLAIAILGLSLATLISGTAFAATKKKKRKINTVSFKVMGNIDVDTQIGMENLDFTTSAGTYHVENFEVQNQGFKWTMNDVPEYKVTLTAEDEYEFNVKKAVEELKLAKDSLDGDKAHAKLVKKLKDLINEKH